METEVPSSTNGTPTAVSSDTPAVPVEGTPAADEAGSEVEKSTFGVSFAAPRTTGAPPEASGATATPVKPYTPVTAAESSAVKMSSVYDTKIVFS